MQSAKRECAVKNQECEEYKSQHSKMEEAVSLSQNELEVKEQLIAQLSVTDTQQKEAIAAL